MTFLMFPSLEIMQLKLRTDIWSWNYILMIILFIEETFSQNVVFRYDLKPLHVVARVDLCWLFI